MENMSRFKKHITATGKITWYFQAFRTTRRGFNSKREAQLAYLEMEKQHRNKQKRLASNDKFSVVSQKWFEYYRSLNEQKVATYDKREEQVKILNRWIGGKKLSSLSSEELQKFLFILKEKGIDGVNVGWNGNSFFDKFYKVQNFFPYAIPIVLDNEPPRM